MVLKSDQQRVKDLLTETITLLCKNGLEYNRVFSIDALIGITLDEDDVFLISIRDTITNETSRHETETSFVRSRKSVPMKRVSSPIQNKKKRFRASSPDVSPLPLKLYKASDIQQQVDQYENKQNSDNSIALSNDYVNLGDDENSIQNESTFNDDSQSNDIASKSPGGAHDFDPGQNLLSKIKQEVDDPDELRILKTETSDQLFAEGFGDQAGCSWQGSPSIPNVSTLQALMTEQIERRLTDPVDMRRPATKFTPKPTHDLNSTPIRYSYDAKGLKRIARPERYSVQFKEAVINRYLQTRNCLGTGKEYGVPESTIRAWLRQLKIPKKRYLNRGIEPMCLPRTFKTDQTPKSNSLGVIVKTEVINLDNDATDVYQVETEDGSVVEELTNTPTTAIDTTAEESSTPTVDNVNSEENDSAQEEGLVHQHSEERSPDRSENNESSPIKILMAGSSPDGMEEKSPVGSESEGSFYVENETEDNSPCRINSFNGSGDNDSCAAEGVDDGNVGDSNDSPECDDTADSDENVEDHQVMTECEDSDGSHHDTESNGRAKLIIKKKKVPTATLR